jgi:hypothetical protein
MVARTVTDVILGEAVGDSKTRSVTREQRYEDMVAIASAIQNRAVGTGVPPEDIVAHRAEFNAYGKAFPPGSKAYADLAKKAWDEVQKNGPVHSGWFYATPGKTGNLPKGLEFEAETTGHKFYSDPQGRSFRTASGSVKPDLDAIQTAAAPTAAPVQVAGMGATGNFDFGGYGGLVQPRGVATASTVAAEPKGLGMAALAPNGLRAAAPTAGLGATGSWREGLSEQNAKMVGGLHPDLRERAAAFINEGNKRGLDLTIRDDGGFRTRAEQAALNRPGAIAAAPGNSRHEYGIAFDAWPSSLVGTKNGTPNSPLWDELDAIKREFGFALGPKGDRPHAQVDMSRREMKSAPFEGGYPAYGPEQRLNIMDDFVPTPTPKPDMTAPEVAPVALAFRDDAPAPSFPAPTPEPGGLGVATGNSGYHLGPHVSSVPGMVQWQGATSANLDPTIGSGKSGASFAPPAPAPAGLGAATPSNLHDGYNPEAWGFDVTPPAAPAPRDIAMSMTPGPTPIGPTPGAPIAPREDITMSMTPGPMNREPGRIASSQGSNLLNSSPLGPLTGLERDKPSARDIATRAGLGFAMGGPVGAAIGGYRASQGKPSLFAGLQDRVGGLGNISASQPFGGLFAGAFNGPRGLGVPTSWAMPTEPGMGPTAQWGGNAQSPGGLGGFLSDIGDRIGGWFN